MRSAAEVQAFEMGLDEEDPGRRDYIVDCYAAGIPRSFWFTSSQDVKHNIDTFRGIVQKYVSKRKRVLTRGWGMILMGDNGSGKTMFACYVSTQFLRRGTSVYYTTVPELNEDFKIGFSDPAHAARLKGALEAELLVLDEMGKELTVDGYLGVRLETILKSRYDNAQPTLITTNLDWGAIQKRYGASMESMFDGRYVKVALEAGDYRRIAKKKMREDLGI